MKKITLLSYILGAVILITPFATSALSYQQPSQVSYPYASGSLVNDDGTIYFISGTVKVPFTNWAAFVGLGYSLKNVVTGDLSTYSQSANYRISTSAAAHPWGTFLVYKGTVYYSTAQGLIGVPSADVFLTDGGNWSEVVKANSYDISNIGQSSALAPLSSNDIRIIGQTPVTFSPIPTPAPVVTLIPSPTPILDPTPSPTPSAIGVCEYAAPPAGCSWQGGSTYPACGATLVCSNAASSTSMNIIGNVPAGIVGQSYQATFNATNTPQSLDKISLSGSGAPAGLQFNTTSFCGTTGFNTMCIALVTGLSLTGTPTQAGTFPLSITATDSTTNKSITQTFNLVISSNQVATPVINPNGGNYISSGNIFGVSVTMTDSTAGAVIYYTTDGTTPTAASTVYSTSTPIITYGNKTFTAIAMLSGMANSSPASATFTFTAGSCGSTPCQ